MEAVNNERTMPNSHEAELSVLGAILLDNVQMANVSTIIEAEDFYRRNHQVIYRAMEIVYAREGIVDITILTNQLASSGDLENIGGAEYLIELANYTPTHRHAEHYAKIIKEKSMLRKLITASTDIINMAYDEKDETAAIIDQSERLILSISEGTHSNAPKDIRDIVKEAFDRVLELSESKSDVVGLPTGYIELDRVTHGFQSEQFIVIAARPAVGKTAFALNIAQNAATKAKVPVLLFSLEMNALDLVNRMICAEGNIHASNLRTGQLTDDEWNSLTVAIDTLRDSRIFIDDTAGIKVSEIFAKSRRLKQQYPDLGLIVIDYIQLIEGSGRESRQQEISEISRQLKRLAMELGVPVIALSQLSRAVEQRQNKRPVLSDIRESGAIEQDADIVMFLHRDDYYQQDGDEEEKEGDMPDNTIEIIIAKNRAGARDTVTLLFKREYNKFSSMSYRDDVPNY